MKDHGIRHTGKPLGRPPKEEKSAYQKRKEKKEAALRNHVEGKFGQGKQGYSEVLSSLYIQHLILILLQKNTPLKCH